MDHPGTVPAVRQLIGEIVTITIVLGLAGLAVLVVSVVTLAVLGVLALVTGREQDGTQTFGR
ncbi:hypothetical protein GCM10010466_27270 [Planomonospora alba]|uniref:Uncharacterized protein n=1 Tax=Planomonospora alba TaxID=161354 RepID=A0ABP6N3N6_9ACTN